MGRQVGGTNEAVPKDDHAQPYGALLNTAKATLLHRRKARVYENHSIPGVPSCEQQQ